MDNDLVITALPLKEEPHSSGEFFMCGVGGCVKTFMTGVAYIYHLNSEHDYTIDTDRKAAIFMARLFKRLHRRYPNVVKRLAAIEKMEKK